MNIHKVQYPFNLTIKTLDLAGRVPVTDSIDLLRVELRYENGYGPLFLALVKYARDGVEQGGGFSIDLDKGAFIANIPMQKAGLEEVLQKVGPKIAQIVREDIAESKSVLT